MAAARILLSHRRACHVSIHSRGIATSLPHANRLNIPAWRHVDFTARPQCGVLNVGRSAGGMMRACRASLSRQSSDLSDADANRSAENGTLTQQASSPTESVSGHKGRAQVGLFDNVEEVKRRQSMVRTPLATTRAPHQLPHHSITILCYIFHADTSRDCLAMDDVCYELALIIFLWPGFSPHCSINVSQN